MNYACLKTQEFSLYPYQIVPLRFQDIFFIKQWRNEQMDILRQDKLLTDEMQKAYFENTIQPSFCLKNPKQILFSFLKNNHCIGYGGMVHIDWEEKQAEISFLVETNRAKNPTEYQADFTSFLKLIKEAAFHDLHFKRLYTETFDIRPQHISILENTGFIEEKRLKNRMIINEKQTDSLIHGCVPHD